MSQVKLIKKKVCLEPQYLNANIKKHIIDKLKFLISNECTKEYGYFLNLVKLCKIEDNIISTDCKVFDDHRVTSICQSVFTVSFEAETLRPEIGSVFEGIATTMLSAGISLTIRGKMKVLIPSPIKGYEFDIHTKSYLGKSTIKEGDKIKVKILNTMYTDKSFKSYGSLVE